MTLDRPILALIIIGVGLLLLLHGRQERFTLPLKILIGALCAFSLWFFSGYGHWHTLFPKDKVYQEARGNAPMPAYLHWHEVFHYYLGAKYYKELGYNGLYEAVALADSESAAPQITRGGMRSLREPMTPISIVTGQERARTEFRPKFTEARWISFKDDLETLKSFADKGWLDLGIYDAGFNPPPTWSLFGTTLANLIPISQAKAWIASGPPHWYQIEWLGLFDLAMVIVIFIVIGRTYGLYALSAFMLLYFMSSVTAMYWISGGFLRFTWLFGLVCGIAALSRARYALAGAFLALSAVDRIFPAVFLAAAGFALFVRFLKKRSDWRPLVYFTASALLVGWGLVFLSIVLYGVDAWLAFFQKISLHKEMFFVHHIGYRRIAVYGPWVPNQNFWWSEGLDRFRAWNANLVEVWHAQQSRHWPVFGILLSGAALSSLRQKPEEVALLLGGLILFLFAIPANYYYVYFPLLAPVLLAASGMTSLGLFIALFCLWGWTWSARLLSPDDLIQNYYICLGFLLFFMVWSLCRGYEVLSSWFEAPKRKKK